MFNEYSNYDAIGLAELVQNHDVTAREVLEASLNKAEQLNPKLNAIIDFFPDEARAALNTLDTDAPFAGVPMLIKDLDTDVKGHATTHGSRLFHSHRATEDCELVKKYRGAGLLIFGKTNAPEFGLNASTEGMLSGACKNPWNLHHSTGGSSGGSAAAVAAGIIPMGHASDGGGSIRIPASSCGLFGLKPGRGLISFSPYPEGWGGLDHMHVMTRSVRDSAALLDESAGYVAGDFHRVMPACDSFRDTCYTAPRPLHIGFTRNAPSDVPVHADCIKAVDNTLKLLQDLGHTVEESSPDYSAMDLAYHCAVIGMSFVRAMINAQLQTLGRTLQPGDIEVATQGLLDVMQHTSAADYATALHYINQTSRQAAAFYQKYDMWLTPTLAQPPAKLGYLFCDNAEEALNLYDRISSYTPFTGFANATGLPAMSVPLHWNAQNLPVGVQFVGRSGDEALMFALAAQLENARPWIEKYKEIRL
jgi:Asp-tRNA(Asn)/Glu-tRNA(Gln) amidotransferase A subunit family amidase